METKEFDHIPALGELLRLGGLPGFDYALVSIEKIDDLIGDEDGWDLVGRMPPIRVNGKAAKLLAAGAIIHGASPNSTIPRYWVDSSLKEATDAQEVRKSKKSRSQDSDSDEGTE
jgi:hypothetical protein